MSAMYFCLKSPLLDYNLNIYKIVRYNVTKYYSLPSNPSSIQGCLFSPLRNCASQAFHLVPQVIIYCVSDWHYRWFMIVNKVLPTSVKLFFCGGSQEDRNPCLEDLGHTEWSTEPAGLISLKSDIVFTLSKIVMLKSDRLWPGELQCSPVAVV